MAPAKSFAEVKHECAAQIAELNAALARDDEAAFNAAMEALCATHEATLRSDLRRLTGDLQSALERFSVDSRLVDLAEKDVPDARHRLQHVLKLTDDAAHQTIDLVEHSCPPAEAAAREAARLLAALAGKSAGDAELRSFLESTRLGMETVRANLSKVLLAQGYQDLTGQIIRGVMKLVGELEDALTELVRLSGVAGSSSAPRTEPATASQGFGPAIPGINSGPAVSGQSDVDSLLADLGM